MNMPASPGAEGPREGPREGLRPDARPPLRGPDLSCHARGNAGLPFVHSFRAAAPGPHAMIAAVVHGNEVCGAIALDRLLRAGVRPLRGELSLAFVNTAAYAADPPARFLDEDLNRVWDPQALSGSRSSRELARARELRPLLDRVDRLLDLHSMQNQAEPVALAGEADKGAALAAAIGVPHSIVHDAGHPAGPRMRDYGPLADASAGPAAVLVECGEHRAPEAAALAWEVSLRFLLALRMLAPAEAEALNGAPLAPPPPQRRIRVTGLVTAGREFRLARPFAGMDLIPRAGTVVAWNDGEAVQTPYDDCFLIMPNPTPAEGTTAVRLGRLVAAR